MLWRTHLLAGVATGLYIAGQHSDIKTATTAAGITGITALLADIDDPDSKIGRIVPLISWAIKKELGHRGPLHSLLGAGIVTALLYLAFFKTWASYIIPVHVLTLVITGYISHLVMDSLNPEGVPWLWPVIKKHFSLPLLSTDSIVEVFLVSPAMLVLCVALAWPVVRNFV